MIWATRFKVTARNETDTFCNENTMEDARVAIEVSVGIGIRRRRRRQIRRQNQTLPFPEESAGAIQRQSVIAWAALAQTTRSFVQRNQDSHQPGTAPGLQGM